MKSVEKDNVDNERFKNNIDINRGGTAEFVSEAIENYVNHWPHHNTLVGFAMDHGCHEITVSADRTDLTYPKILTSFICTRAIPKNKVKL